MLRGRVHSSIMDIHTILYHISTRFQGLRACERQRYAQELMICKPKYLIQLD
jgi:hypothetical protein